MANQSKLKAWVRYDGTGRVISGGPIFQVNKPKVGNWKQIDANLCCNSTLTTTTTAGGGGTPTAFIKAYWTSSSDACSGFFGPNPALLFYSSATSLAAGIQIFSNASLTIPIIEGWVIRDEYEPGQFTNYLVGANGLLSVLSCPNVSNVITSFNSYDACAGFGYSSTLYYTGPLGVGTALFTDSGLTNPYNPGLPPSGNGIYVRIYFQAEDQVCTMSGNVIQSYTACSGITTTTTTTTVIVNSVNVILSNVSASDACSNPGIPPTTIFTTAPFGNYPAGTVVYFDPELTQPVNYSYVSNRGIGIVWQCNNGVLSTGSNC